MFSISPKAKRTHALLALALIAVAPLQANAYSQAEAQNSSANTNHRGSDDDQDLATRNAMKAFMNLAALNIPGAISKGYEAYGNYINSEKLDDLEAKTKRLRNSMGSAAGADVISGVSSGSGSSAADSKSGVSGATSRRITTLSNLDGSFLYKGETAQVAEEFEKRSGMKREEFFKHLSAATDAHYNWDDPDLQSKLESRFQAFKDRIPNKDFKSGLERAEALVPDAIRTKMLGEAMAFYKDSYKTDGSKLAAAPAAPDSLVSAAVPPSAAASTGAATTAPAVPAGAPDTSASAGGDRAIASLTAPNKDGVYPRAMGMYIGLNQNDDALNSLLQGAGGQNDGDSIFKAVSLRYRKLTPMMTGRKTL